MISHTYKNRHISSISFSSCSMSHRKQRKPARNMRRPLIIVQNKPTRDLQACPPYPISDTPYQNSDTPCQNSDTVTRVVWEACGKYMTVIQIAATLSRGITTEIFSVFLFSKTADFPFFSTFEE